MIESLSVTNLRSFDQKTRIRVAPLTVLLGQNSSGKSSITRLFPLLKQTATQRTQSPILWNSTYVDFGSFSEVVNHAHASDPIEIEVALQPRSIASIVAAISSYDFRPEEHDVSTASLTFQVSRGTRGRTKFHACAIILGSDRFDFNFTTLGRLSRILMNGTDVKSYIPRYSLHATNRQFLPSFDFGDFSERYGTASPYSYTSVASDLLHQSNPRIPKSVLSRFVRNLTYTSEDAFPRTLLETYNRVLSSRDGRATQRLLSLSDEGLQIPAETAERLRILRCLNILPSIASSIQGEVSFESASIQYISPLRSRAERYYRIQELSIDDIDPTGENVAMYLHYLSPTQLRRFNVMFSEAFGYSVVPSIGAGHVSLMLKDVTSGQRENIADVGFGFSQVLPIVAQIHAASLPTDSETSRLARRRRSEAPIIAIEQPELHLHPAYQAKIADLLANLAYLPGKRNGFRFVVETHSEALVNRLGRIVAGRGLPPEAVLIYTFEKQNNHHTAMTELKIGEDGVIKDWPVGFLSA